MLNLRRGGFGCEIGFVGWIVKAGLLGKRVVPSIAEHCELRVRRWIYVARMKGFSCFCRG